MRGYYYKAHEPDGGGSLEDVEVLQDVRNSHQTQGSQKPESCFEEKEKVFLVIFQFSVFRCYESQKDFLWFSQIHVNEGDYIKRVT